MFRRQRFVAFERRGTRNGTRAETKTRGRLEGVSARAREGGRRTHPVRLERGELFRARGGECDADRFVSEGRRRREDGSGGSRRESRRRRGRRRREKTKVRLSPESGCASANVAGGESETRCLLRGGDEGPTGTHRGESQSGMGKPRESYSAPPVDEVEVAETCQASVGEKHAR